jgi:hypothetical protein
MIYFEEQHNDFENVKPMGFVPPVFDEKDYVLGVNTKLAEEVIKPDGQWLDIADKITKEYQQKNGVESMGCTGFGTLNANEILHLAKYNTEMNWSDRGINIEANNTKGGNNPKNPAEALRKLGVPDETDLPFDSTIETWEKFHSPKPLTQDLKDKALKLLDKYEFGYEWLWQAGSMVSLGQKLAYLKKALPMSPIGISVCAWKYRNGMYWKNPGEGDNHWCVVIGYKEGEYWLIFDTYDGFVKKLEWLYDFGFAIRYSLKKKLNEADPVVPPVEENNMKFYKIENKSPIYQLGADHLYHRVGDENTFKRLYGEFSDNVIENIPPATDIKAIGDPIYLGSSLLNILINFFSTLKGKMGKKK